MQLDPDGAQHHAQAFSPAQAAALGEAVAAFETNARINPPGDGEGNRPPQADGGGGPALESLLHPAHQIARHHLGAAARPVRAIFVDKSAGKNWSLGWHQDRTIAVAARRDVPGFGDWTVKQGIPHCVPPFDLLTRTLTLRVHLDEVDEANAPLLVSPGTHARRWSEPDIPAAIAAHGSFACLAAAGDAWAYATPILHASERARAPRRRRVLQLLYAAEDLPGGLAWLGI